MSMSFTSLFTFAYPLALLLFLPLVALVLLGLAKKEKAFQLLLRTLALGVLIFALSDPTSKREFVNHKLLALVDQSASITPEVTSAFSKLLEPFLSRKDLELEVIPFAKKPATKSFKPSSASELEDKVADADLEKSATNLQAALLAASTRGQAASVLLLSDGQETAGDARAAARELGIKIYPLLPATELFESQKLIVRTIDAPLVTPTGEDTAIRVTVANSKPDAARPTLRVSADGEVLFEKVIDVAANSEQLITLSKNFEKSGLKEITAELLNEKSDEKSSALSRFLTVREREKLLLLSGSPADAHVLSALLKELGYSIEAITAEHGPVEIPAAITSYSAVIVNNIARSQLPGNFLTDLKSYVSAGNSVLLIGGERSFGLGDYINTPLEEISPLKFVPPQTKEIRLNNAVVLVIDKSRSMLEDEKIEQAKKAALMSINSLKDDDLVSVIGFDSAPFVILPLNDVKEVKQIAERRLQNLTPSGKTNPLPAISAARQALLKAEAGRKHIIMLTDGKFPIAGNEYVSEINQLRAGGITLSTIALGDEADVPFMKMLAQYGKGSFHQTMDAQSLPEVFIQDIRVQTSERTLNERSEFPVAAGPTGIVSTHIVDFPNILGFVETRIKNNSSLELITRKKDVLFPILASWKFQGGKVIAFTSDANGRWTAPWMKTAVFADFWRDILSALKKDQTAAGGVDFDFRSKVEHGALDFDLTIFDESLLHRAAPRIWAEIKAPNGRTKQIDFETSAKGRFTSEILEAESGRYTIDIHYGDTQLPTLAVNVRPEELGETIGGLNLNLLSELADRSGARINPAPDEIQLQSRTRVEERSLRFPLFVLGLLLLLFSTYIRERQSP